MYVYSLSFEKEVVKGINVYITGRRSRCKKARPLPADDICIIWKKKRQNIHDVNLPSIVFGIQQEICTYDSNAYCHYHENYEY